MEYPQEQIEALKGYCSKISALPEGGVTYLYLAGLRLPQGCQPDTCDALLCPAARDGYPSRLFFSQQITPPYPRNWNISNLRIGEKNWWGFSWRVDLQNPTLQEMLVSHLSGFAKEKN